MSSRKKKAGMMWGGCFGEATDGNLRRLNDSFGFDRELASEDIRGSIAWAGALKNAGVLSAREHKAVVKGLESILEEVCKGRIPVGGHEDIHSFVESRLKEKIGRTADKLHTGRSRNDQVATDFRLYVKAAFAEARRHALDLAGALAGRATDEAATPMPGYTHSRRAIPVTFGHWCLAYCEMLVRDASRLSDAAARADECPLGSGALAGTPVTVDREALARDLGFSGASRNSIDAVSDRDFAAEYLFCAALLLVHLSRLAEDVIMFSSDETGFLAIPDSLATGSSRMPHKKNPDLLELGRGHAGRAIGELAGFLSVIKGLPLAYDKDLQLDKEPVFRLRGVLGPILSALSRLIQDMRIDREAMRKAASDDRMLATDLADALAARGIPFREAHEIVGRRVMEGGRRGCGIAELGAGGGIERRDLEALDVDRTLSRRNSLGGTAPDRVIKAAEDMATLIGRMRRGL